MKIRMLFVFLFGLFAVLPAFSAVEDNAAVLYNKGIDLYEQNKLEQSIATFKKAISIEPDFYEAYYNLARIQEAMGKTQDAMVSYEALLKISPKDYESTYQYAELLYKKGYLSKSLSYLNKIPSNDSNKQKATALSNKIVQRQKELAEEARIKAEQKLKTSVIQNVQAPSGVVVDSLGNIFTASFSENIIYKISKDDSKKTVFKDKTSGILGPIGLGIDSLDNIYVANYTKGNVTMYDKNGKKSVLMFVTKPYCISINEEKARLFVTEQQNNTVLSFDISDILKTTQKAPTTEVKKEEIPVNEIKQPEKKVIMAPLGDDLPIGVPSIRESGYTQMSPSSRTLAPIMIPSSGMFE